MTRASRRERYLRGTRQRRAALVRRHRLPWLPEDIWNYIMSLKTTAFRRSQWLTAYQEQSTHAMWAAEWGIPAHQLWSSFGGMHHGPGFHHWTYYR